MRRLLSALTFGAAIGFCGPVLAEEVGKVGVDWLGNDIIIEAIKDPEVDGVTCHVSYFDRSVIDRLQKGNWFEDPSDSSISCRQTGPITIGDIDLGRGRRGGVQARHQPDLEEAGGEPHLRQGQRHADLSVAFAPGAGRLGKNVDHDRAALWPERHVEERQAEVGQLRRLHRLQGGRRACVERSRMDRARRPRFTDPEPRIHPTAELKGCRLGRYASIGERVVLREVTRRRLSPISSATPKRSTRPSASSARSPPTPASMRWSIRSSG